MCIRDRYELHPKFSVGKEVVAKKMVRDNALLLSVAAQFNESVSVEIMGWLANTTIVLGSSDEMCIRDRFCMIFSGTPIRHRCT